MLQEFPSTFIARCLGFDESREEFHFLWQEQKFSLKADQNLKITEGALVRFQYSLGNVILERLSIRLQKVWKPMVMHSAGANSINLLHVFIVWKQDTISYVVLEIGLISRVFLKFKLQQELKHQIRKRILI